MPFFQTYLQSAIAATFLVIVVGLLIGRARVAGVSLGTSAVLFVALLFGHFGWVKAEGTKTLGDFGVVLFVYAIGLQAGPRFVRTVRSKGWAPVVVGLATVVGGATLAGLIGVALGLDRAMILGVFAGALTSTPALAAATEAINNPLVAVAYGLSYPFGVIGVVLFAQLAPRWFHGRRALTNRQPDATAGETVHQRCFLVQNPGCIGRTIRDLRLHDLVSANISRVARGPKVIPAVDDTTLERNDVLLAVGTNEQLDRLALLIGPPVPVEVELREVPNVLARDIYITESSFAGKSLRELHIRTKYGAVITRVRREGIEFVPRGEFVLEVGDQIRAVGYEPDIRRLAEVAGIHEQRIHETGILQFAAGLVLGLLVGFAPLPLPGGQTIRLGLAGGPLFVGILLGHFGRIGRLRVYVPPAARYLMRELGLVLFLVSAGAAAGADLVETVKAQGVNVLVVSLLVVVLATLIGFTLAYVSFRQSLASSLGMTCGAMTSTPGLGAVSAQFDSDVPALSYAAVYPLALVAMTVTAQLLAGLLH